MRRISEDPIIVTDAGACLEEHARGPGVIYPQDTNGSCQHEPSRFDRAWRRVERAHASNGMHLPPHNVMSKTSSWGWKNSFTEQLSAGQFATGIPSVDVSMLLAFPSSELGMFVRCVHMTGKLVVAWITGA